MINEKEAIAAGYTAAEIKQIESIVRRIANAVKEAVELNLFVFAGSGGTLRTHRDGGGKALVIADISLNGWDGGCGASNEDKDGLLRGES